MQLRNVDGNIDRLYSPRAQVIPSLGLVRLNSSLARVIHDLMTILQNACVVKKLRSPCPKHRAKFTLSKSTVILAEAGIQLLVECLRFSWVPALLFIHKLGFTLRPNGPALCQPRATP